MVLVCRSAHESVKHQASEDEAEADNTLVTTHILDLVTIEDDEARCDCHGKADLSPREFVDT